jgi:MFS transporter, MHS family, alpha-ketoglutarate permease
MNSPVPAIDPSIPGQGMPAAPLMRRFRSIVGGSAGNLVEWYDWNAYAIFALYFAHVFFPPGDRTAQLLQAAAVFALGFIARPIGAWVMGLYADRAGRRAALTLSVGLMCLGSFIIAATPGYPRIGMAAPAILLGARLLQGLSIGGEYGASATYLSEMAGRGRRGFGSSFQHATIILGQLVALLVLIVLQKTLRAEDLEAWGWRIPFVIGGLLAVVVFWIRRGLDESVSWQARGSEPSRAGLLITEHPREMGIILALTAAGSLSFYAYTTYMQKFLVNTAGFTRGQGATINVAALLIFMLAQPLMGWVSDRIGRKKMLILAFGLGAVVAYPVFAGIARTHAPWVALGLCAIPLLSLSAYTSIAAAFKAELLPAHIRALGVALPYAIANAVFGGTAEYIALWFKRAGAEQGFFVYVAIINAIALGVSLVMRDTQRTSRILED